MCDCVSACICLLAGAVVSYYTCNECIHYKRLENGNTDPK